MSFALPMASMALPRTDDCREEPRVQAGEKLPIARFPHSGPAIRLDALGAARYDSKKERNPKQPQMMGDCSI